MAESRLEKFNRKYAKDLRDREDIALKGRKVDKNQSQKRLEGKGNIEEAAAVMSNKGMEVFASTFANTVERLVREQAGEIEKNIERIVENKILEAVQGVMAGLSGKPEAEPNHDDREFLADSSDKPNQESKPTKRKPLPKDLAYLTKEEMVLKAVEDLGGEKIALNKVYQRVTNEWGMEADRNNISNKLGNLKRKGKVKSMGRGFYSVIKSEEE